MVTVSALCGPTVTAADCLRMGLKACSVQQTRCATVGCCLLNRGAPWPFSYFSVCFSCFFFVRGGLGYDLICSQDKPTHLFLWNCWWVSLKGCYYKAAFLRFSCTKEVQCRQVWYEPDQVQTRFVAVQKTTRSQKPKHKANSVILGGFFFSPLLAQCNNLAVLFLSFCLV